jgi:hypothetical protein
MHLGVLRLAILPLSVRMESPRPAARGPAPWTSPRAATHRDPITPDTPVAPAIGADSGSPERGSTPTTETPPKVSFLFYRFGWLASECFQTLTDT